MMSNDGAMVLSFDEHGPLEFTDGSPNETSLDRSSALAQSDIIITGVPNLDFALVKREEVSRLAVCVNFSSEKNFNEDVKSHVRTFIPRVGPMTVAMCMRNTIRLFENFHHE